MPERCANVSRVYAYLINSRGIEQPLIAELLQKKLLYQDKKEMLYLFHIDRTVLKSVLEKFKAQVTVISGLKGVVGGTGRSAFEYIKGVPEEKVCLFESAHRYVILYPK